MTLRPFWLILLIFACLAAKGMATRDPGTLCDEAAATVAQDSGVPPDILLAITRVETGRTAGGTLRPWPWTINNRGSGAWFQTRAEAVGVAEAALLTGSDNLDIGCFQVNHRWHGKNFASLDQMFDPATNARYAAGFLSRLHQELGTWSAAAAAYHSRSAGPAAAYLTKVEAALASLRARPDPLVQMENGYPLLQAGARGSGGSLVPRLSTGRPLFGDAP